MTPPPGGRKRHATNFPAHIKRELLPENVSYKASHGYWRIAYYDDDGRRRFKRLCAGTATLSQITQAAEAQDTPAIVCFRSLSLMFQASPQWRELAPKTRRDYLNCHKKICGTQSAGKVLFGDIPYSKWKKSTVLNYRDFRAEESKSRANKELSYIKGVLAWASLYELVPDNIAKGVPKLKLPPRQHYAEDKDFNFLLEVARGTNYWYVPYVLRFGFECRMRTVEILGLTDANETREGLLVDRHKGSRNNITLWDDNLRQLWDGAKAIRDDIWARRRQAIPIAADARYLFISDRTGDPITEEGYRTAKSRVSKLAKAEALRLGVSYTDFTTHDTKRKGITDTEVDKKGASGLSENMMKVYDVSVPRVNATSKSKKPGRGD